MHKDELMGEQAVDEQRVDGERAGSVSSAGSERKEQREEHDIDEKKWWRSNPLQQPFVVVGLGDHDGGKDGIRDSEQRDGKGGRRAGARAAVRPAAALHRGRGRRQRGVAAFR